MTDSDILDMLKLLTQAEELRYLINTMFYIILLLFAALIISTWNAFGLHRAVKR